MNRNEKKYLVISITHKGSLYRDNCSGYTNKLEYAGLYSLNEIAKDYDNKTILNKRPAQLNRKNFYKYYQKYDAVMYDVETYVKTRDIKNFNITKAIKLMQRGFWCYRGIMPKLIYSINANNEIVNISENKCQLIGEDLCAEDWNITFNTQLSLI